MIRGFVASVLVLFLMTAFFVPRAEAQLNLFSVTNEQYITSLYNTYLGRAPDTNALNYFVALLNSGKSRDDVKGEIAGSLEAQNYAASRTPKITSFTTQKTGKNIWYFSWSTAKADSVILRVQCVNGISAFVANTKTAYPCDSAQTLPANSAGSLSFSNTTGKGVTLSVRLYAVANNSFYTNGAQTSSFYVEPSLPALSPLTPSTQSAAKSTIASSTSTTTAKFMDVSSYNKAAVATSTNKSVSVAKFTIKNNGALGSGVKLISWAIVGADGAELSVICPPSVVVKMIMKSGATKAFSCGTKGQKFLAKGWVNFKFTNTATKDSAVTINLSPLAKGVVSGGQPTSKSFNLPRR